VFNLKKNFFSKNKKELENITLFSLAYISTNYFPLFY